MKKYAAFFTLHVISVVLWAVWALPSIGESGTLSAEASWIAAQMVLPVFITLLLVRGYRPVYYLAMIWGILLLLSGAGLLGWALMGIGTPIPVYLVSTLLLLNGLGIFSSALKDLNWIRRRRRGYAFED